MHFEPVMNANKVRFQGRNAGVGSQALEDRHLADLLQSFAANVARDEFGKFFRRA